MPLQVEGSRIQVLGPVVSSNMMGSIRRARELSDIAPQYVAKSGLCSATELESSRGGSIRIQHVTGVSSAAEGKSRFPKLDECAHFHYEHVEIGPIQVSLVDEDDLKPLSNETEEEKWWSLSVTSHNKTWLVRRSYDNFRMLDQQLHRCIYDRKFSELPELPTESVEEKENLHKLILDYASRFSAIAGNQINCGPILNWLELDNRGHRLIVPDTDNCPINTPAVAAAYSVRRYTAQAPDEISFEVGDMISVIDMPPSEESIWWRGKRGFQVGFFPCECVAVIGDKVPRNLQFSPQMAQPTKPVLRKHGKLIAFFRSFILSRPSRRRLKQTGILKERVFGCDLGEHLLNSGHEIPMVLKCCVEFIESHGLVDGIYRLSGVTSNIQKLRNAFDEDRVPALYEDEAILQDVHSVASLLKMYFRELPNPLCTYQLYHQFVGAVQATHGDDTRLLKMRDVVQKLPPPHYRTLEYLMRHLARVSEKGHETGMTSRNVAIVWAPNLLRCKELEVGGVAALQGVGVQAVVTEFLVCYADLIFCDKLPNFSLPSQQVGAKKSRPKSLAISTPTKLLSLEEARSRALLQASGKVEQDYIEVGGGPANLPAKYHTVIELPGGSRKRMGSKRSPIGWKMLFGKSGRGSQSRKEIQNKTSAAVDLGLGPNKAVTELDLAQTRRRLRPAKSVESLTSNRNSGTFDLSDPTGGFSSLEDTLSPMLLRNTEGKGNGHNRSVSHESYFDQLQDQKEDAALDISEIQVNFDLEESEMRIFSEDETLMSVGSGSLASNSSPRILPMQRSGKSLITGVNKRLSYPKLGAGEDRFCTSQSADPSPKKQKINDGTAPRSKLEEQLSSSVGEIQFIDSVSPDQVLVQAEVHPIQSPSPVSSISHIGCTLLAPSSPILPHIPHLTIKRHHSQEILNTALNGTASASSSNSSKQGNEKRSTKEPSPRDTFSTVSDELGHPTYLTSTDLPEPKLCDNSSVSLQSFELRTPETPMCQSYSPLVDLEESSISSMTTPDFDQKDMKSSSENENLDKAMTTANLEFDNCPNIGMEYAKFEERIISDDSVEAKPKCENVKEEGVKCKSPEILPPKPEERKPRPVHPYVNIPLKPLEEPRKVLETCFDLIENSEEISNRNSVISIKYEAISTESSCDSLMNVNNVNRGEESSFLLGEKSSNQSPSDSTQSQFSVKMDSSKSSENNQEEEGNEDSEMNLFKECNDWLQTKQEFYLTGKLSDKKTSPGFPGLQESLNLVSNPLPSDIEGSTVENLNAFHNLSETLQSDFVATSDGEEPSRSDLRENDKTESAEVMRKREKSDENICSDTSRRAVDEKSELVIESVDETIDGNLVKVDLCINSNKLQKRILETNLDEVEECDISLISSKKLTEKPVVKKRTPPQKSNSSGNVRQLLSKFEVSPTTEKDLIDLKFDFEIRKKGNESNVTENGINVRDVSKGAEERPKTLERLSTRRKTEKDLGEPPEVLMEKSKSGSHINQRSSDGGKPDILLSCDFDLSDPQRRERIEKYKEKRRNYLREKYRSDSFKTEKDDFVLRIKPRKKEEEAEKGGQSVEKSSKSCLVGVSGGKKSPERKSPEKSGKRNVGAKSLESPSRDSCRVSFGEASGRLRYECSTISSSIREQSRRNNFLRFSSERKSASDFRPGRGTSEKKNLSLDFSSGVIKEEKLSPEFLESFYSRRRMTDPARPDKSSNSSYLTRSHKSSCSVNAAEKTQQGSPLFCIKDMTALFEKRDESKTHKQYLSSV